MLKLFFVFCGSAIGQPNVLFAFSVDFAVVPAVARALIFSIHVRIMQTRRIVDSSSVTSVEKQNTGAVVDEGSCEADAHMEMDPQAGNTDSTENDDDQRESRKNVNAMKYNNIQISNNQD